ncbi:methyl-accepting chemotaxis protein [Marinobacterium lutimaris]|uniref:Methyl-accepting chemotaxis sensory transducer with Pas/Pac sensor n=1 Tax=Marinobacterium lutimaris TaxID=568106 RepID=A0A1H6C261_9GAMM|nr:PAS domain-containing methyl-accepting chemotaxis protein [Marinobacterium lutimaris]SEG67054.1 methyl-accepting chemotaxis sensory transducer with Pas/Pac sensor [Marinobacterium lutimaris]
MKQNLPVTHREVTFSPDIKLISSTDLKGRITHCNQAFVDVSGFSREELVGQAHNIVRHPDMPPAAFQAMWGYLKAGKPWMGMVKNRCKNGDYYWVSAYITPVMERGKVIGYESVRSSPSRQDVGRAEKLYTKLNQGKIPSAGRLLPSSSSCFLTAVFLLAALLFYTGQRLAAEMVLACGALAYAVWNRMERTRVRASVVGSMGNVFSDDLAALSFTDDGLELGRIRVAVLAQQAHLDAVLTRLGECADEVHRESARGLEIAQKTQQTLIEQGRETDRIAEAIGEMSGTIAEVSSNVQETAARSEETSRFASDGSRVVSQASEAIDNLKSTVLNISESVNELANETRVITDATRIIEVIAEQTNLLALNAAIEAARAGNHGRGFAVVAEEVRNLALRTQDSTREIHGIIESLNQRAERAVSIAAQGNSAAEDGARQMVTAEQTLHRIQSSVSDIAQMAMQMAAAVEEQAQVSDQINGQVTQVSSLARSNQQQGEQSTASAQRNGDIAAELHELVLRFK